MPAQAAQQEDEDEIEDEEPLIRRGQRTHRVMTQFGLAQEVPGKATRLAESHNVVLTGPKNKDWRTEYSVYIMRWINHFSSVLVGDPALHYQASDRYMQWYTEAYGAHLRLNWLCSTATATTITITTAHHTTIPTANFLSIPVPIHIAKP
ncbi:hypothetical protein Ahy_A10g048706 [Arachis hypogaea]|uniref:Aminotransferase-like plant mobile domain-containing protein n=1 Tax=Arachis hypogaea TaxID=3818 RepID=A0A445B5P6_ARAHY|nr:hypothetical protein Ahy_A10g048706 [Arachis hypogaea]